MSLDRVNSGGLVLLGCGKMGSAMLQGWLAQGVDPKAVAILDPNPSDWVRGLQQEGVALNGDLPKAPAVCIVAVKPQMMGDALPRLQALGNGTTVFISVAAGTPMSAFEAVLGAQTPIIRAMPNTPAAVGKGITALIGNTLISEADMTMAEGLLQAVGQTVRLDEEGQMDAVTGVSGSGPAYVFHLIETLAAAGAAQGLPEPLAMKLAKATVAGAGVLAEQADENPSQLRINVTSPAGTTAAALEVLMDAQNGFPALLKRGVKAATDRSRELGT
ncbi:pyrroline-5-carboxylate reductase [Amylibacter sp. IMCC11727]|uniref:pyrroline-5-carboxylate reductase n=1 Tax=Amylibacter sp. IMCC11727 TaxID=3039851 RepID=UPI00244E4440|nr:pyrroline-5-carboxylate reductase [Amylibacter sp. IMCC11727]WGI23023.1 pyrroline-5-carboxylate reductase [Amylibacter sp. IMCC11727]